MADMLEEYKQLKQDYLDVFSSEKGKRVFEDLASKCFLKKTTFDENPYKHAHNEGKRCVLLHIQTMQELDLDKLQKQLEKQGE